MGSESYSVVITTCATKEDAQTIASALLEQKLAACVQSLEITSAFFWEGSVNNESEQLLLIKAKTSLYSEIEKCIVQVHKYDIPEIVRLSIEEGLAAYLKWIEEVSK